MRSEALITTGLARATEGSWVCHSCATRAIQRSTIGHTESSLRRKTAYPTSRYRNYTTRSRNGHLPDYPARTRFAPSPTGYMHIGGLRTALFSYLLAKRTGGQFILRVEDTDQKRFVPGAIERLCSDLRWGGLQWDEGPQVGGEFGPYQQSQRNEIYREQARTLLDTGSAYSCFCTPQNQAAGTQAYVTSGCYQDCASLPLDEATDRAKYEPYTVRLRQTQDMRSRKYPDLIYGNIKRLKRTPGSSTGGDDEHAPDPSDTILMKSDGTPTYHFANVVDDHLMQITHVIRGTEWMASTPLHYDLYHAFGWQPPIFAHVGLLLDQNKAKLSKRNADLSLDVQSLVHDHDVLPETLCNFLALQGWSNPAKSDVLDMDELVHHFDLKFTTGNTMVGMDKLWFLQRHHVERRCKSSREHSSVQPIQPLVDKVVSVAREAYPTFEQESSYGTDLQGFCTLLLLVDDKSFRDAKRFVERNAYMFNFEPCDVPDPQDATTEPEREAYDKTSLLIAEMVESEDLAQAIGRTTTSTGISRYNELEKAHHRINRVLASTLWTHVLGQESSNDVTRMLSDGATPAEIADLARLDADGTAAVLVRFKTMQKLFMKQLRDKLCCGNPGPSMSYIIALLGIQECRRRLQL